MTKTTKTLEARVLVNFAHDGELYRINRVITLTPEAAEGLQKAGYIDTHPSAVQFAKDLQKGHA